MILLLILLNFFTVSNQAKQKPIEPDFKLFSAFNEKLLNLPDVTESFLDKNGFQNKLEAFKTAPICSLKLDCSGSDVSMVGYVNNFREYPLKLNFSTDYFEKTNCFEKSLNNLNTQEQTIDCWVSMFGNKKILTSLVIEDNDYVKTYYSDRIFGTDQTKFVTRNQTIGIVKDWIKTNNIGAENNSFTLQNIKYINCSSI